MAVRNKALRLRGIGGETASQERPIRPGESAPDDTRAAELLSVSQDVAELRARARAALAEEGQQLDDERLDAVVTNLNRLRTAAQDLKTWMIETGRLLLRLQELAGKGGYKSLARAGLVAIPESTASNLRKIAQAVLEGKVEQHLLPNAVKPAYALARLPAEQIAAVTECVPVGPDTTVREIRQATAAVRAATMLRTPADASRLEERIRQLEKRRDAEIERVRQRYAKEIEATRAELEVLIPKRRGHSQHAA
jgi:hypothetical protein